MTSTQSVAPSATTYTFPPSVFGAPPASGSVSPAQSTDTLASTTPASTTPATSNQGGQQPTTGSPVIIGGTGGDTRVASSAPTFSDNFGGSGIDQSKWLFNYPWSDTCDTNGNTDRTQAAAYVSPNCASQAGANVFTTGANGLDIAIKPTPAGVDAAGKPYITGQISSKQAQLYGYFEMTAKVPATSGIGGAFWLLPQDGSWPPELDIMENLGHDPNTIYQTIHGGATGDAQTVGRISDGGYHTYAADWGPNTIKYYIDGKMTQEFPTPASMHKPMYMIVSMNAMTKDSPWGRPVDGSTQLPASYSVQSVHAYANNPYAVN